MEPGHGGFAPGMTLGTHRLERLLGRGGMGAVFLAYDTRLHRQVAVKIVTSDAEDGTSSARLLREARNAAALNHPHICTIHEVGEADGTPFIAMEYVDGRPLRERIDGAPLPVSEAVRLGIQAADALAYAHEHGVVHRDFKAANAIVDHDGRLKVVDFGMARRDDLRLAEATTQASLVMAGAVAGTPYAMAPEQVRGQAADARTDVWALGVLLYEMVTSVRPFTGETVPELFSSILTKAPVSMPSTIPTAVRAVIERCLEKDPARRYQQARDVHAALETIASGMVAPWVAWVYHIRRHPGLASAVSLLGIAAVLAGLNTNAWRTRLFDSAGTSRIDSIAVLPLNNYSGDSDQEYFSDGLTDALITDLATIGGLKVISRSSIMRYKGTDKPLQQIARELGVDAVLEGSVQRVGHEVEVTARLIDPATTVHLWAESYVRTASDVLQVPGEVALAVAQHVNIVLTPEQEKRLTNAHKVNPEVYEAYLRGTFFLNQGTSDAIRRGLDYLRKAVETDPADPLAYAGLALGYSLSASHGPWAPAEAFTLAKGAARQALQLDDTLAEAHAALAQIAFYQDRDWRLAEQAFRRALELNPNLAPAHAHYAMYLALFDRYDEATVEIERAHQADPLNPSFATWIGDIHWGARNYDKAIEAFTKSLEVNRDFPWALRMLGFAYDAKGMYQQAVAVHEKAASIDPGMKADLAYTYALAGRRDDALKIAADVEAGDSQGREVDLARIHTALGNTDAAFRWLQDENGKPRTPWIKTPWFDPLSGDPRYDDLLRRLNIPPRQ